VLEEDIKMSFDVRLYHKSMEVVGKYTPRRMLKRVGNFLFRTVMLYLRIYTLITHKTRERFVEYNWVLDNVNGGSVCLNVGSGDTLLDCGLSDRFRKYISIDLNRYIIATNNPAIEFVQADITCAPFKDETFDTILAISTIEHIDNDIDCITEIQRLLKPTGKIYVSVPLGHQFYSEKTVRRLQPDGLQIESEKTIPLNDSDQQLYTMILTKEVSLK
jgi:SAM-dependent methyltransferase